MEEEYRRAMEEREAAHFEWHYLEPPDHDVWLEIDVYPAGDGLALFYRDITQRKRTESTLRDLVATLEHERARVSAVLHNLPSGVIVAEAPSGRIVTANERVAAIWQRGTRYSASVAEYDVYRGFHPDGRPYEPGEWPLARAITSGETVRNERIEILRDNGTRGIIMVSAAPIRDDDGSVIAGVVIFEDVTDQVRLERDLKEMGDRLSKQVADWEALFDLIPVGIAVARDPACETIRVNPAFAGILQLSPDQNVSSGGPLAGELPYVAERDGRALEVHELPLQAAARSAAPVLGDELELVFRDGHRAWLRADAVPLFGLDGQVRGALGAFTDVTEHRQRERTSRLLANVSATLARSLDFDGTLRTVAQLLVPDIADWCVVDLCENGAMRRVAVEHRDESLWETARTVERYPPVPGRGNRVLEVCESGEPILVTHLDPGFIDRAATDPTHARAVRALGVGSFIVVPLSAHGMTYGAITAVRGPGSAAYTDRDVHLLREIGFRAALALGNATLYAESQRLSRAKSEILAATSHELRTPLNAIIGYASLLKDGITGPVTDAQEAQLSRISAAATHLLRLIDEILTLARIEAGKQQLDLEEIDLVSTLREVADMAESSAAAKGLRLETRLPGGAVMLTTDATKLRQVVLNLLSNAVKFTAQGSVTLSAEESGEEITVWVADTGIGIAPEHLDLVFEPFFQEDHRNLGQTSGTGLGLAVSRELARLMGGDLTAASTRGVGTVFHLRLPRQAAPAADHA